MGSQSSRSRPQVALKLAALVMLSAPTEHHPSDMFDQLLAMHRAVVRADLPALHSRAAKVLGTRIDSIFAAKNLIESLEVDNLCVELEQSTSSLELWRTRAPVFDRRF